MGVMIGFQYFCKQTTCVQETMLTLVISCFVKRFPLFVRCSEIPGQRCDRCYTIFYCNKIHSVQNEIQWKKVKIQNVFYDFLVLRDWQRVCLHYFVQVT